MYPKEILQESVNENGFETKTNSPQEVSTNQKEVSEKHEKEREWKDEDLDLVALRCRD